MATPDASDAAAAAAAVAAAVTTAADDVKLEEHTLLWTPSEESKRTSHMFRLWRAIEQKYSVSFKTYHDLWQWSVDNIPQFWAEAWGYLGMEASTPYTSVVENMHDIERAKWFVGAKLNFAQNLLRFRDDRIAFIATRDCSRTPRYYTYSQVYDEVARLAKALRELGVTKGDRVGGVLPNIPQAAIAMLAATSIGALWSSCAPEFGVSGIMDRFGQIEPKVVFLTDGYFFKGKLVDCLGKGTEVVSRLTSCVRVIVVQNATPEDVCLNISSVPRSAHYADVLGDRTKPAPAIDFEQVPFDHPVYIMYSSGTTGLPKCIVQGAGVVLNHLKELVFHCDLRRDDRLFYYTTTGWMMWNWLISALGVGCTLVLFDGAPLHPEAGALFRMAQDLRVTHFGASARYLHAVQEAGCNPKDLYDLSSMRMLLSTGSPATGATFDYVYQHIKPDVQFASISGGTDLNGCFALGCPLLPVHRCELQCRGLGLKVAVFDDYARPAIDHTGELVCEAPFPSQPLFFWKDETGALYHKAYFDVYRNIWRHGDFATLSSRGGLVIFGRSDATLNPGGVRMGTSEFYRVIEEVHEIEDSVVIGQNLKNGDERIVLFVKMPEGKTFTDALKAALVRRIREELSPRHIPAIIMQCPDIPYTLSGKKVELAVKKAVEGQPVLNKDALSNPASLDFFQALESLRIA